MGTDAPLVVPDYRRPGHRMGALPVKLPADALAHLQNRAARLGCSRGALARTLIVRGLSDLETVAGEVA